MKDLIHVKSSALIDWPECGYDSKSETMAWTTWPDAQKTATCPECLSVVLRDGCTACEGTGRVLDTYDNQMCGHCDAEAAEHFIAKRGAR